jgi:hypothetical protein
MNSERSKAYGRVIRTLEDVGPAKLLASEQETIRDVADTLLFATELDGSGAREALAGVGSLLERLVESGRWSQERASELAEDLGDCGPLAHVV